MSSKKRSFTALPTTLSIPYPPLAREVALASIAGPQHYPHVPGGLDPAPRLLLFCSCARVDTALDRRVVPVLTIPTAAPAKEASAHARRRSSNHLACIAEASHLFLLPRRGASHPPSTLHHLLARPTTHFPPRASQPVPSCAPDHMSVAARHQPSPLWPPPPESTGSFFPACARFPSYAALLAAVRREGPLLTMIFSQTTAPIVRHEPPIAHLVVGP